MSQKPPVDLAMWQWALIGSGCTLLLASAAYGAFNLIANSQGSGAISKNPPVQGKSADANILPSVSTTSAASASPTTSNTSDKVAQSFSNIPIAGTWLIKTIPDNKTIEVVVTNDGRIIVPDPTNSSRAIEGATNIRRISSNTNATSSDVIASISGTWLFEMQETTPNNEPIQAIISSDGIITANNPKRSYQSEEIAKVIRKVSDKTTIPFATIITVTDFAREQTNILSSRARQSEAKTYVGAMNRAQQAFYLEKVRFASSLDELALGISAETPNYSYRVSPINNTNPLRRVTYQIGQAKQPRIKSYIGAVRVVKQGNETTAISILCETDTATTSQPPLPILIGDDKLECAAGTQQR